MSMLSRCRVAPLASPTRVVVAGLGNKVDLQRRCVGSKSSPGSAPGPEETTLKPAGKTSADKPKRTQAEADAALMAAYREKFGGDTTATFEDGKPSEMSRSVKNNMFRCKWCTERPSTDKRLMQLDI